MVVLVFALALPSTAVAARRAPRSFTVVAEGGPHPYTWEWNPGEVTIAGRGKVTWKNPTTAEHHVTFWDGPSSGTEHLEPGGSVTLAFKEPGIHRYRCDLSAHSELLQVYGEPVCVGQCGEIRIE